MHNQQFLIENTSQLAYDETRNVFVNYSHFFFCLWNVKRNSFVLFLLLKQIWSHLVLKSLPPFLEVCERESLKMHFSKIDQFWLLLNWVYVLFNTIFFMKTRQQCLLPKVREKTTKKKTLSCGSLWNKKFTRGSHKIVICVKIHTFSLLLVLLRQFAI